MPKFKATIEIEVTASSKMGVGPELQLMCLSSSRGGTVRLLDITNIEAIENGHVLEYVTEIEAPHVGRMHR